MLMLNLSALLYNNLLKVELRGYDPQTMIEHFPLTGRYFIYSIPKAKCRSGH